MRDHRKTQKNLYDYARGEVTAEEGKDIKQHLAQCRECRKDLELLSEALQALPPLSEPPSIRRPVEYWNSFAQRVEYRLADQRRQPSRIQITLDALASYFRPRWKLAAAFAGGFAMILLAVRIWMTQPGDTVVDVVERSEAPVVQASHNADLQDYFERSKTLLIGIANIPAEEGEQIDLSVERTAARSLVHQARYLNTKPLDTRSRELIRELERVLIELANMEDQADVPEVEMIRTGLRQQNLLFKIRMTEHQQR